MKIQILSDIHREVIREQGSDWHIPKTDSNIIVLAGDIDVGLEAVQWAIDESERLKKSIIMVAGNHEFWGSDITEMRQSMIDLCRGTNVHLLDRHSRVIDGVRFLGTTLWTNYGNNHPGLIKMALHIV